MLQPLRLHRVLREGTGAQTEPRQRVPAHRISRHTAAERPLPTSTSPSDMDSKDAGLSGATSEGTDAVMDPRGGEQAAGQATQGTEGSSGAPQRPKGVRKETLAPSAEGTPGERQARSGWGMPGESKTGGPHTPAGAQASPSAQGTKDREAARGADSQPSLGLGVRAQGTRLRGAAAGQTEGQRQRERPGPEDTLAAAAAVDGVQRAQRGGSLAVGESAAVTDSDTSIGSASDSSSGSHNDIHSDNASHSDRALHRSNDAAEGSAARESVARSPGMAGGERL